MQHLFESVSQLKNRLKQNHRGTFLAEGAPTDAPVEKERYSAQLCFFRKKPPARQIRIATPATMAEPTIPETEVPAGLSLSAKA